MGSTYHEDKNLPIAVVGIACRLPGASDSPSELWDNLAAKRSAKTPVPSDRFNQDAFYHPDNSRAGSLHTSGGYYMNQDIAAFDAPFFSISRADAISMDPMQRVLLEVAYEATENAGIPVEQLAGTETACFVGCFTQDYDEMAKRDAETLPKYHTVGTGKSILSNRVSFCFDLKGPSMTLDTACSSSSVAIHLACQSLKAGECTTALVGATNLLMSPDFSVGLSNLSMVSADSISYAFDERANGYARGEGVACLVLKPLHDAIKDGDTIRCVIRGTSVNSNGKGPGITMPSREAQIRLMKSAYRQAGLENELNLTGYVEAHGTGTQAGDPIETGAIGEYLGRCEGRDDKLYIGSIKANIGHLEGASGLAGLIKAILIVERGQILPNIWFKKGNPKIDFEGWNLRVPTELVEEWPVVGVRRASINGFGYGGTNAHVIIDDAYHYLLARGLRGNHKTRIPSSAITNGHTTQEPLSQLRLFPLSASDTTALTNGAKALARYVESFSKETNADDFLESLSYTLSNRRSKLEFRHCIVAATEKELVDKLNTPISQPSRFTKGVDSAPQLAFIFTGQGAQWWGMGRELVTSGPAVFKASLERCAKVVADLGSPWKLIDELLKSESDSRINEAPLSQPLCTALQIALVDLLASWGVSPSRVAGHSSGEIGAAYAVGALSLEAAMKTAYYRGMLAPKIRKLGYKGGMLAVGLGEAEALAEIEALNLSKEAGKCVVACVNSPRSTTISGDVAALTELQAALTPRGIFARKLLVDTAYHSHHMQAISEEYKALLGDLGVKPADQRTCDVFFSSVKGRQLALGELFDAQYWADNMVGAVRFSDAVTDLANSKSSETKNLLLVELGPHSALAGPIKQILAALPASTTSATTIKYQSALARGKNAQRTVHELVASLLTQNLPVNLFSSASPNRSFLADLPPYSWNHTKTYWCESRISKDYRFRHAPRTDLLGAPVSDWNPLEPRWRGFVRMSELPWVADHVVQGAILYPAAGYVCMALQAAEQLAKLNTNSDTSEYRVRDLSISRALVVPQDQDGVEVIFSMRPAPTSSVASSDSWKEFRIFSYTVDGGWTEHCRGLISSAAASSENLAAAPLALTQEAQLACVNSVDADLVYKGLDAVGLSYGPYFQSIKGLLAGSSQQVVLGSLEVTDTKSGMPKGHEFPRLVHPTTMDAMLQLGILALCHGDVNKLGQAYVPTFIKEITVSGKIDATAGKRFSSAAKAQAHGFRNLIANVSLLEEGTSTPVMHMEGVECRAISSSAPDHEDDAVYEHVGKTIYEPDVDLLDPEQLNAVLRKPLLSLGSNKTSRPADQGLRQLAEYVKLLSHKNPNLDYLEIGAGSGAWTSHILAALNGSAGLEYPRLKSYLYTDVSTEILENAETLLKPEWGHLVSFKQLDIGTDLSSQQGFDSQADVVIVGANVLLDATKDTRRALENTRKLLRTGGKLVLLDMTAQSEVQWSGSLAAAGFSDHLDLVSEPLAETTRLMIASAVETPKTNGVNGTNGHHHDSGETVAILHSRIPSADEISAAQALESSLAKNNDIDAIKLFSLDDIQTKNMTAWEGVTSVISLVELEKPWLKDVTESDYARLQTLITTIPTDGGIIWATRGGETTRPEFSLFQGLARVLRNEDEGRRFISVDFSEGADISKIARLVAKLYQSTLGSSHDDNKKVNDEEFVEKDGMLWVKRLVKDRKKNQHVAERTRGVTPAPEWQAIGAAGDARRLVLRATTIGSIDSLVFVEEDDGKKAQQQLQPGHVEIEIRAVGLNSRDVSIALGELADNYLGNECAGVVTKVARDVANLAVGDRVAAWCLGSFATRINCPAACVQPIPDAMSFSIAASLPLAYATAYHSLANVARLRAGESLLVHAGAGGVGQAAIQLAQRVFGVSEVYVTVGSDEKKELIAKAYGIDKDRIFNSRDLSFVSQIQRATGGRGVDVVLNSLSGEAMQASWTGVLAPFGRFVELGRRDIDVNGKLDMAPYAKNALFAAVDVTHLWREHPALAGQILGDVMKLVSKGAVQPVQPLQVEPFSKVREAFRLVQSGQHMGKVVLEFKGDDQCLVVPSPLPVVAFPADATYLLAGGLGGLGRSMSRWMVERGARNLAYVSRSGGASLPAAAKELIEELNQAGVRTALVQCDITDAKKLSAALGSALKGLPPLRGVIQGAMVLNDASFANMNHSSFVGSLRPKVHGSEALHQVTMEMNAPLDFFIMLSSVAGFVGNRGQANYVAGCNYQVALAKYRREHLGLPATSIDVGKMAGVGVVAEKGIGSVTEANLTRAGFPDVNEGELLAMLELAMAGYDQDAHVVTGCTDIVKREAGAEQVLPFWGQDPVFSHLDYVRPQGILQQDESGSGGAGSGGKDADGPNMPQIMAKLAADKEKAEDEETAKELLVVLARRLARALMISVDEVDTVKSPSNMGADSLVAIEIRNWLSREGGIEVPVFDILQAPSLVALAGTLLKIARVKIEKMANVAK